MNELDETRWGYLWEFPSFTIVVEKLAVKHHVTEDEVEEVFFSHPLFRFAEHGHCNGEDVYSALGRTDAGRYLIIFFIYKPKNLALIVSARDMDTKERRRT
ncbi:MAG: BrnT family toxin, partial [Desulfobacteraceae bacterium]